MKRFSRKYQDDLYINKENTMTKKINVRIKIVIALVTLCFFIITLRLIQLQIFQQTSYAEKIVEYTAQKQKVSSPRGTIYDSKGNILVESVSSLTISYYPNSNTSNYEEWELAKALVEDLALNEPNIIDRNIAELHIRYLSEFENKDPITLLSEEDQLAYEQGEITLDEAYELQLEAVDIESIDTTTKMIYEVKMKMDSLPSNQFKSVVENVSEEQMAIVAENSSKYPGFTCTFDWERSYTDLGLPLISILGNVSSSTQGVPLESQEYYTALGYELNQRVGTSGLEKQYEDFLAGTESIYDIEIDSLGNAFLIEDQVGKNGYDLHLTLDANFNQEVQNIVTSTLSTARSNPLRKYFDNLYVVVINPQTGEVLSMAGATLNAENEVSAYPNGAYQNAYLMGSVVKIATLYMGQNEGVTYSGEVINDAPIQIKGSAPFKTYTNWGLIDDVEAIRVSSNVYMAHIAMRIGGGEYVENESLYVDENTFQIMRNYYNMFGLGISTGIDLPNEQVGAIGLDTELGKTLFYAIGQYDTYTTMQLAQYVSTIANGGKRIEPHLLSNVSEVNSLETIIYEEKTKVLDILTNGPAFLESGKQGMELCVSSGSCGSVLREENVGMQLAAKTGTADALYYDPITKQTYDVTNATMIAYEVSENPEYAVVCSAPNSNNGFGSSLQSNICGDVVAAVTKAYIANK